MAEFTLLELHVHDGVSFTKSTSAEPEATDSPATSGPEEGVEQTGSGFPLKAVVALVVLGLLAVAAVAIKVTSDEVSLPDGGDELSDAL